MRRLVHTETNMDHYQLAPLLGPAQIRLRAEELGVRPTKKLGQNFLHDAGTVRRIVAAAEIKPGDSVVEVGPGLGSLTLGLLEAGAYVAAIEIDPVLAAGLPDTVIAHQRAAAGRLHVCQADALTVDSWGQCGGGHELPVRLAANLPYNVAVPILLHFLALLPSLRSALVMVQSEVADRLVAGPGSRVYGVPSVKAAWYGTAKRAGAISRTVFWPVPNVDSALVDLQLLAGPRGSDQLRRITFRLVDAAFAARRKMLRSALRGLVGDSAEVALLLEQAHVDGSRRGETLTIDEFVRLGQVALGLSVAQAPQIAEIRAQVEEEYRGA